MNDKRRPARRRLSNRSLTSLRDLDGAAHLIIDHRRYLRDWYYRLVIRRCVVAELLRVRRIEFDFVWDGSCADDGRLATLSRFEYEIWLDLPAGTPPLQVSA